MADVTCAQPYAPCFHLRHCSDGGSGYFPLGGVPADPMDHEPPSHFPYSQPLAKDPLCALREAQASGDLHHTERF